MAHELETAADGTSSMAYVHENGKPWHGLGQTIEKGAKPREILKKAGLNWKVERSKVQYEHDGQLLMDDRHQVLYRSDNQRVLDVTGPGYVPHQNLEVLEFFQEYVEAGDMYIDTAGALKGGTYVWVLAKMDKGFTLKGGDRVEGHVLLMNPHQYGKGMIGKFTSVRVVCWNTLTASLAGGGGIKVWHTTEFDEERRREAKEKLGIAKERLDAFKDDATILSRASILDEDALRLIAKVMKQDESKPLEQQNRTVTRMYELYNGAGRGAELVSAKNTLWGVLNAVTEYIDHEYGRSQDARLQNSWLGTGEVVKRRAHVELLQAAKVG